MGNKKVSFKSNITCSNRMKMIKPQTKNDKLSKEFMGADPQVEGSC